MIEEPWRKEGFNDIPRSEQIVQIFTVVDKMIKTMKEGVSTSQRQVEGLQRRMERLETLVELIDEAPEMEPLPSQRGGSVGEGEARGVWYYSLEAELYGENHPHPPDIMQHR